MSPTGDYEVIAPLELLDQLHRTRIAFMAFMGSVAAISLLVGGIGIMNIMLATVTERTREIGVRRALGARRADIVRQFLVETMVVSVSGGVIGVAAGLPCPSVIAYLRDALPKLIPNIIQLPDQFKDVSPQIVPWSIPLGFVVSVALGVTFGLYPAYRAAILDPIDALRHE